MLTHVLNADQIMQTAYSEIVNNSGVLKHY